MRMARVLGKTAALVSSLTLLGGFVAFRAGALDRPTVPAVQNADAILIPSIPNSRPVLAAPRELTHNWLDQTVELNPVSLVPVPLTDSVDPIPSFPPVAAPVMPGSQGIYLWETSSEGRSVPLMTVPPSTAMEPVVGHRTASDSQAATRKTVIAGSKGMTGIFVPPKPFYNSTAVQPNVRKTMLNGSKSGSGFSLRDLTDLGILVSSLNLTGNDVPALKRETVPPSGDAPQWLDHGSFPDTILHFELSPDDVSVQEIRPETRTVISGSKTLAGTPMQDWSHINEIFAAIPWLFDHATTTPSVLSPQPDDPSGRISTLSGSKSITAVSTTNQIPAESIFYSTSGTEWILSLTPRGTVTTKAMMPGSKSFTLTAPESGK